MRAGYDWLEGSQLMSTLITATLVIAAVIHLLPVSGVLSASRLTALYGLRFDDPSLVILMRHRAVQLGLVGLVLLGAAWQPALRPVALVAGLVSVVSFLALAWSTRGYNAQVRRVVVADVVALACLVVASVGYVATRAR